MHSQRHGSVCPPVPIVILSVVVAVFAVPPVAWANWPPFGRPVSTAPGSQTHSTATTDGSGGAIIAWQDHRNPKVNIFAQHVLASGEVDARWLVDGRAMMADTSLAGAAGGPFAPLVVSDGAGGGIVAWVDLRDVQSDKLDIFAQRILASGVTDPHWKSNGQELVVATGLENSMAMVSDGAGGAIITWADGRGGVGQLDVFAQHVLASGVVDPGWPANGMTICAAPGHQQFPAIAEDGAGGAIIAWQDGRDSTTTGLDVYAQHILNSGALDGAWPMNGRALCTATGNQGRGTITTDGNHGAVITWTDGRTAGQTHIFAQHVLASGAVDPAWPTNGRAISNAGILESRPLAISDGQGGAIVNWQAFTLHLNMYAQHVTAAGVVDPAWPAGGRALSVTDRQQDHARIVPDAVGGAVVAWEDSFNIVAQHVLPSGALDSAYPDTGRVISGLPSQEGDPALVGTVSGGAIVVWTDTRKGTDSDIYAMEILQVTPTGVPDSTPRVVTVVHASPNPARVPLTLRFALPRDTRVRLSIFDAGGRRVRELISGTRPAGSHELVWDLRDQSGRAVGSGIYFARLEAEGRAFATKLVTVR